MIGMDPPSLGAFAELGLSEYEAKAYLALLQQHPQKAQGVSKLSGIPAARVYDTLNRLVQKGLAVPVGSEPVLYEPLPAREFVRLQQAHFGSLLKRAEAQLHSLDQRPKVEVLWHVLGYDNLIVKVRDLLGEAEHSVLLSACSQQVEDLYPELAAAAARGVRLVTMQMGEDPKHCPGWPLGQLYRHLPIPSASERHGDELLITIDERQSLMMSRAGGRDWEGFWTSNLATVSVITNYIRHDIYINKVISRFPELRQVYGENLELLICIEEDRVLDSPRKA